MIADDLEAGKLDDTSPYAELEGESKEEYFERTLRNATGAEIYLEYLIFLKSLPNVHCNKLKEIQNTVRKELRIDQIEEKISLADLRFSFSPGSPEVTMQSVEAVFRREGVVNKVIWLVCS